MFRWSVLMVALLATAPTIWAALAQQSVDVASALEHYLVAVVVSSVLLGLVRTAMQPTPPKQGDGDQHRDAGQHRDADRHRDAELDR